MACPMNRGESVHGFLLGVILQGDRGSHFPSLEINAGQHRQVVSVLINNVLFLGDWRVVYYTGVSCFGVCPSF